MINETLERLRYLCKIIPNLLMNIDEIEFSRKPSPEKWSKKEILGHLIDSATNNHHRFIRSQFENIPDISYNQDSWNTAGKYNEIDSEHLIEFWTVYNRHLLYLVQKFTPENLNRECNTGGEEIHTLEWLVIDYVRHLEHHLKQLTEYK